MLRYTHSRVLSSIYIKKQHIFHIFFLSCGKFKEVLLFVHDREGPSDRFAGGVIDRLKTVSQPPAAAEGPEDEPASAHQIASGDGSEKAAVKAEIGVVTQHEIMIPGDDVIFFHTVKLIVTHVAQMALIAPFAGVEFLRPGSELLNGGELCCPCGLYIKLILSDTHRVSGECHQTFHIVEA